MITIAFGGDILGISFPYFASLRKFEIITVLIVHNVATAILCYLKYKLSATW
jgi:cadmium resistance protein CadD (predicted permease)